MKRALLVLVCACGDDRPELQVFEPTSGTRLMIEQYQFDDGTRLVQPTAFFDRRIHARCTPQEWIDGVTRCVPDAEEAFYRDDTCETVFGRATMKFPTHFIARDTKDGLRGLSRVFAVGAKADPIAEYYVREGVMEDQTPICTGPFTFPQPEPEGTQYYELAGEIGGEDLVPITETEIGEGRLGLVVRESDDGALVPLGFRDRDLDVECRPLPRGADGICEPMGATPSTFFADTSCTQPAVLAGDTEAPAIASTTAPDGCFAFHTVETTAAPRAYRATTSGCTSISTTLRVLPLGAEVELAAVARAAENAPKRRVQRILASEGDLHVYANRMLDTATGSECELAQVGDTLRCLPTALAPIVRLFQPGCVVERRLAQVPTLSCEPFAFAMNDTGETLELHAIGDPFDGTAYTIGAFGACTPYTPLPGTELHHVGPILPEDTFIAAVPFGAR